MIRIAMIAALAIGCAPKRPEPRKHCEVLRDNYLMLISDQAKIVDKVMTKASIAEHNRLADIASLVEDNFVDACLELGKQTPLDGSCFDKHRADRADCKQMLAAVEQLMRGPAKPAAPEPAAPAH